MLISHARLESIDQFFPVHAHSRDVGDRYKAGGGLRPAFQPEQPLGLGLARDDRFIDPTSQPKHSAIMGFGPLARHFRHLTRHRHGIPESLKNVTERRFPVEKRNRALPELFGGQIGDDCLKRVDREVGGSGHGSMSDKP